MLKSTDNTKKSLIPEQFKKHINNHITSNLSLPDFVPVEPTIFVVKKAICEYGDYCINQFDTCVWKHKDQPKVYDDVREICKNGDSCIYKTKVCQKNHHSTLPPYIKTPKCKKGDFCPLFKENKCYLIHPKQIKDCELFSRSHSLKETEAFVESIKINTFINNMEYRKSQKYKSCNNKQIPSLPFTSSLSQPLHSPFNFQLPLPPPPPPPPFAFQLPPLPPPPFDSGSNTLSPNFIPDLLNKSITYNRGRSRSRDREHRHSLYSEREHRHRRSRSRSREHRHRRSRSRDRDYRCESKY